MDERAVAPDHDDDAERALLGAMLISAPAVAQAITLVTPNLLYRPYHRLIWSTIVEHPQWGDQVLIQAALLDGGHLRKLPTTTYLVDCVRACTTPANVDYYAAIVVACAQRRARAATVERLRHATDDPDAWHRVIADASNGNAPPPSYANSWAPVNLTAVLADGYTPPVPTVGRRDDGVRLFYPGRIHTIAAESEAGKTWFALAACASELATGNAIIYIDYEDDAGGVIGRLTALGLGAETIRNQVAYVSPTEPIGDPGARTQLERTLDTLTPSLVVIDGVTEAMAAHGLDLRDNADVAHFGALLPRWLADRGPAVVTLDHVVKDRESRGRYAIGGVHKLNGVNGAAYLLETRVPFGIGTTGRTAIYLAKDRPGALRRHAQRAAEGLHWFADLVIDSHDATFVEVNITPPGGATGTPWRPTVLMTRVSDALTRAGGPLSKADIEARVQGKAADIRTAIAALIDDGYISVTSGPHNAKIHTLIKPYGENP